MLKRIALIFCLIFILTEVKGQDIPKSLDKYLKVIGVKFTPNEQYAVTPFKREGGEYACKDIDCPLWQLQVINAELVNLDKQCKVYVYISGAYTLPGKIIEKNPGLFGNTKTDDMSYNRIKSDFRYGRHLSAATKQDIVDIKMMLHYYPQDSAKELFNAGYMMSYPFNMQGRECHDNFTRSRVIVIGKNGLDIFLYFVMTDKGIEDFDKYLNDFKGTFWYN